MKNKRDIVCKFELNKFGQDPELEKALVGPEKVWNMEFKIYLNDNDEAVDTGTLFDSLDMNEKEAFDPNELEKEDYFESNNEVDVYLFNPKLLKASQKIYNEVITAGTLQNIVARVLTATGHKKVLMSPIENFETYQELLIPPLKAYKALMYLDQYYGLYKFGALIYYDLDKLYIINPNGKLTAKEKKEWTETSFLITKRDTAIPGNAMIRKPGEKVFYVNIPEDNLSPYMPSIVNNENLGSIAKIVTADGTSVDYAEADQSFMNQRNEYIKYTRDEDTKYLKTILKARMEENECNIYINGDNFDINAFALNKTYKLIFDEQSKQKKYGKNKYRIAYAYHFLKAESEGYMISSHRIVLKKCSKL